MLLHDLGGAAQFGIKAPGADVDNQRAAYDAYIAEVNDAGGVSGRKLKPVYRIYDASSEDSARSACNQLTEDDKVFAVLAMQLSGSPALCFTQQHKTLLISATGLPDEYYRRSAGLLFTTDTAQTRTFRNQVADLHQQGVLKGKTIGVLTEDVADDYVAVEEGLLPALKAHGYSVAHYARLSGDQGTSQSQVPLAVQQMRSKGVDLVFFGTNLIAATNFAQNADAQAFRPLYATNDSNSMMNDIFLTGMPDSFTAVGITSLRVGEWRVGRPEPAYDAGCREQFERASGMSAQREDDGSPYGVAMNSCNLVRGLVAGLRSVGTSLTQTALSTALQQGGSFDMAFTSPGSFAVGKFDAPDFVRTSKNDMSCKCWKPVDEFRRTKS